MDNVPATLNIIINDDNYLEKVRSYLSGIFFVFILAIMLIICYTIESLIIILY